MSTVVSLKYITLDWVLKVQSFYDGRGECGKYYVHYIGLSTALIVPLMPTSSCTTLHTTGIPSHN